jgi:inner membrane protein
MQIATHILSGWCVGASLKLTARERLACMLAASLADLDGGGIFFSGRAFTRWHHVLGHNVFYGLVLAALCARLAVAGRRVGVGVLCFALFHLHLAMDYWGSGQGWGIAYWWPFKDDMIFNLHSWELVSWQNTVTTVVLLVWAVALAWWRGPWPTEMCLARLQTKWLRWRGFV